MWFEVLPPALLMYVFLEGPRWIVPKFHEYLTGKGDLRRLSTQFERDMFHRDHRITGGTVLKRIRLEAVSD